MSGLLRLSSLACLSACATLAAPSRIASLGAPAALEKGENEVLGGVMYRATSGAIGPAEFDGGEVRWMHLLGGARRWAVGDRVAVDVGAELSSWSGSPFLITASAGPRYTSDPKRDARRAVWFDVEGGVGAALYPLDGGVVSGGVYAGAGVAVRFDRFTTFARVRSQLSAGGAEVAEAAYHSLFLGGQHPVSKRVQGSLFAPEDSYAAGPYWLHVDVGVRVRWARAKPR